MSVKKTYLFKKEKTIFTVGKSMRVENRICLLLAYMKNLHLCLCLYRDSKHIFFCAVNQQTQLVRKNLMKIQIHQQCYCLDLWPITRYRSILHSINYLYAISNYKIDLLI